MTSTGRLTRGLFALVLSGAAALTISAGTSSAGKVRVLGAAKPVQASCPDNCLVEGRVTGFQTSIGRKKRPFVVPATGRIVAWSIKLGDPVKADLGFFNRNFGPSRARISILKPVWVRRGSRRPKRKYRLLRQGPVQNLRPFFGEVTTFGLPQPLRARKGNIVALTIPTWAPAFAIGQKARWRASRAPTKARGACLTKEGLANVEAGAPHERVRSLRRYGCVYKGARLLYTARFVQRSGG